MILLSLQRSWVLSLLIIDVLSFRSMCGCYCGLLGCYLQASCLFGGVVCYLWVVVVVVIVVLAVFWGFENGSENREKWSSGMGVLQN